MVMVAVSPCSIAPSTVIVPVAKAGGVIGDGDARSSGRPPLKIPGFWLSIGTAIAVVAMTLPSGRLMRR